MRKFSYYSLSFQKAERKKGAIMFSHSQVCLDFFFSS